MQQIQVGTIAYKNKNNDYIGTKPLYSSFSMNLLISKNNLMESAIDMLKADILLFIKDSYKRS